MEALPTCYDVFLSFRGAYDRTGFVYHLYKRLLDSGVRVSRNDCALPVRKEKGTEQLVWAISRCKIAIPIISRGYASSTWCLEELAAIMDCRRRDDKLVFPVFYNVDVVDLGRRRGDFDDEMKCSSEEVLKWQEALTSVARIRGWISQSTADGIWGKVGIKL
ncbi:toll/interleukin-1 receptor-like protein [Eucalyptus grandis]|uniref:toll/interleukin-1 receptor-like protein n=1 Tax=Eucalyptus grandis TaxID=71139 RepID=UPI00192F05DC|nr:toll/interleukin-1 receptor-like protein [Eucalyptus grandis]